MDKLVKWLTQPFVEDINIPVKVGDTILTGRFKNKKTVVKSIGKDEHGMPTINGRKVTTFRVLKKQEENINEGVNDPGIFKAVFLAGGPGSGKTYVAKQLFGIPERYNISMTGMKMVNSDKELKFLLNKYGFGTDLDKMPDELFKDLTSKGQSGLRDYAKSLTKQRMKLYQDGKLGMIIDGTGHDYSKIAKMKRELQEDGYDTYMVFVNTSLDVAQQRNQERDRILPPDLLEKSWKGVQANLGKFQNLFKSNFLIVDNSKFLKPDVAQKKFASLVKQGITKFTKQPIKNKIAKSWIKKQQILKQQGLSEAFAVRGNKVEKFITGKNVTYKGKKYKEIEYELVKVDNPQKAVLLRILSPKKLFGQKVAVRFQTLRRGPFFKTDTGKTEAARIPRKKGQHRNSPSHSDLYTDENPKGTIKGLKFATVKDAQKSVSKIKNSGKSHAHKIQAAVAMEQRAKEMGKKSQAAVYRTFINKMKKKTKKMNEKWSDKYKKSIDCNNPKGFSQKAHCDGKKKKSESLVGADGTIPSPSRKMVKKMKKKGHTSVPYGSGYKKVNEDRTKIKKVVGIYGGRFQPFGPHHKKTYDWLKSRVDDAYITTSNIKQPPRHPMDFREKVRHMVKMGIPKNRIIQEKSPYVANNVLKKYDEKTTAVIYIFGSKDAGRLKGGKYFKDYNKNRGNILGYKEHGYVLTAPHVSIKVGGKEVSGTVMRQLLGSPDYEKDREKLFKQAFGYFDKGIYNMMTNKFKKLFESIDEFLSKNDVKQIIKEASTTTLSPTDDGPPTFYRGFDDYKKFSKDWIDGMYYEMGWELINYILGKHAVNPDYDYTLSYNTVPAVAYGRKQSGSYGSRFGTRNPIKSYKDYIESTVLKNLGYEVIKWMGITPDGNKYTGVEVETPVLPGIGKDNTANTELDKKEDLEERLRLDDYVKLLIEQDDVMDKKIKYKTKDGNEKEVTVGGALKQGEEHPAYKQAKSMTDKDEKPDTSKKIQPTEFDRDYDEKDSVSTKKRMDKIKSFGKDPHGNLYLGDEEVGYEPEVHKAQYVTETDDSMVIGTPHMSDKDPKAGEFVKKQVVPMVQDFIKKHGAENVVFLGEGGQGDGHNYHEGTEQELVGKMVEKAGGDVDTWDGKYNEHTNQDAPIYKDLAKKMNATPSQMTGAMYAFLVGQGDNPKEAKYLTDEGKQYLKDNGYNGKFPPSKEDVEQLFNQSFPEDTGKAGSTTLGEAQLAWNQLRRDNMARKMEELKKQGKKVLVVPGATHGSAINSQSKKQKKEIKEHLLLEGGAYGHMNHPFDDKNLTFSDLKQIIINGLGGNLNREDNVTEKLDGQNLMVSWVNGKLVTARNKGQLKNFGATAMDTAGVASKFAGRGDIRNAFVFAMKDLSKSVGSLSDKQKEKVFGNGKRWMNLEVIYPKSVNVIDYDKTEIVFHGTLEYDDSGKAVGQPKDSARMLAGMIKQVNQNVQKTYNIGKPQFLQVPKVQDFGKKKNTYLNRLKKLQNQYKLKDNDTLALYHQRFWEEFIFNASKQYKYKIPTKVLVNLTKRWAFFDKSYKIPMMKKDIKNKKFLDWALSFDKNDHQKWVKQNMKPFEVLFFDVGAEILKNIGGYLSASPDKAVQKIRKDVINAIKTVKSGGDVKKIETLKHQLSKLEKIGGLSSIVPSEGIVFKYKGNTYKFTGAFAPVNQIVGLLNF